MSNLIVTFEPSRSQHQVSIKVSDGIYHKITSLSDEIAVGRAVRVALEAWFASYTREQIERFLAGK